MLTTLSSALPEHLHVAMPGCSRQSAAPFIAGASLSLAANKTTEDPCLQHGERQRASQVQPGPVAHCRSASWFSQATLITPLHSVALPKRKDCLRGSCSAQSCKYCGVGKAVVQPPAVAAAAVAVGAPSQGLAASDGAHYRVGSQKGRVQHQGIPSSTALSAQHLQQLKLATRRRSGASS
jgi:hypothetical protein